MEIRDLAYIIQAHTEKVRPEASSVRKWDEKTPYYTHPIWCAAMIRSETSLPEEIRVEGSQVLLYHDILEDTTAELPLWLSDNVKNFIHGMTFKSSEDEWENLWQRDEVLRLLKLYDKTHNIMDAIWMQPERKQKHLDHLKLLCWDVEGNYGMLNITKIAKAFI